MPMALASQRSACYTSHCVTRGATIGAKDPSGHVSDEKARMVHIRLDADLHRALRLIVAERDTTLQEWISQTLKKAVADEPVMRVSSKGGR